MSTQHTGRYTEEEIADLYTRYPDQKVKALVAEAELLAEEASEPDEDLLGDASSGSAVNYADLKVDGEGGLVELLKQRELPHTGNKAELVARLEEADSLAQEDGQSA